MTSEDTARDKYGEAIDYLTEHPSRIDFAWQDPNGEPGGALFLFATKSAGPEHRSTIQLGCLTQIRAGIAEAATLQLTRAIAADIRIPERSIDIEVGHLPVFAEWQRRLDRELERS